ncbi:MAG TPA: iron ABC transporter permease [bacterium]|nr:iron ABC transporter permease [bacterium]
MKNKYGLLLFIFIISILSGICLGTKNFGIPGFFSLSGIDRLILFEIRIPRVLAGFIVGAGLSVAGSVLQAILRNPLAESYTLGISGGASLGICMGVLLGKFEVIPYFAFMGSIASILVILAVSSKKRFSNTTLILLGVALNFLFSSLVLFIMAVVKNDKFQSTLLWLIGDISYFPAKILMPSIIIISLISAYISFSGRIYDILSMGDEKAVSMGIDTYREKRSAFLLCCIIVGFCVSLSGIIGFVGLIIPHVSRFFFGSTHRKNLPASFIAGGSFLVLADTLARTLIKPVEIPVGVITGFFGGLFFIAMLLRSKQREI